MAFVAIRKLQIFSLNRHAVLFTAVRNHWNKDYKPGAYPVTKEERDAAAKKYGLLPEEYKPFPDDGNGLGDYPDIPQVSAEAKDPYYPWDNPELRRNYNEVLTHDFDAIGEDRVNISETLRVPLWKQWLQFLSVMGGSLALFLFTNNFRQFHALAPKQYPHTGVKHYTFEKP